MRRTSAVLLAAGLTAMLTTAPVSASGPAWVRTASGLHSDSVVASIAQPWASGFWPITGCTFDDHGNLWVSEFATGASVSGPTGGALVKVPWANHVEFSARTTYGVGRLKFPGGVATDNGGNVYIANLSTSPSGTVLRLRP